MAKQTDTYVEAPAVFSENEPGGEVVAPSLRGHTMAPAEGRIGHRGLRRAPERDNPDFNPTVVNLKPGINEERITDSLSDGVSYFHIRAVDGAQNFSRTVHYKLQLALSPLPGPVVVSATHPQGQSTGSGSPAFTWTVDEMDRVKGFVYVLSYNSIKMPDTFTTKPEVHFDKLEMGNYFFSVAAVDKANQMSRITTYDFIIGSPDRSPDQEKNADYNRRLAELEKDFMKKKPDQKAGRAGACCRAALGGDNVPL